MSAWLSEAATARHQPGGAFHTTHILKINDAYIFIPSGGRHASASGTMVLRVAGVEFEGDFSFAGLKPGAVPPARRLRRTRRRAPGRAARGLGFRSWVCARPAAGVQRRAEGVRLLTLRTGAETAGQASS
jgi:hypothetical protein